MELDFLRWKTRGRYAVALPEYLCSGESFQIQIALFLGS